MGAEFQAVVNEEVLQAVRGVCGGGGGAVGNKAEWSFGQVKGWIYIALARDSLHSCLLRNGWFSLQYMVWVP